MKKTVILLILTLMMVVSGMCYAAGDGSDLNRQQKVADKFMAVLSGDAAAVTQLQVDMVPELAEKMTAANFAALQNTHHGAGLICVNNHVLINPFP